MLTTAGAAFSLPGSIEVSPLSITVTVLARPDGVAPVLRSGASVGDVVFVTGTLGGVTPVTRIDGRVIGDGQPGPLTAQASALYQKAVAA